MKAHIHTVLWKQSIHILTTAIPSNLWVGKKKRTNLKIKSISTPAHFLSLSLSIQNGLTRAYVSGEVTMLCIDRQDDNDDERKSILSCVRLRPLNQAYGAA